MQIYELQRAYMVSLTQAQDVVRSLGIGVNNYLDTLSDDDELRVVAHFEETFEQRPPPPPRARPIRRPCGCGN